MRLFPLILLALTLAGCDQGPENASFHSELPSELQGVQLVESLSGLEAQDEIHNMHGRGVASEKSWIGLYRGENQTALLFVSRFESKDEGREQLESMAVRMGSESKGFTRHTTFKVAGTEVHSVWGSSKLHYFYRRGADLIWLTASPAFARSAIAELLDVSPDDIPEYVQLSAPVAPTPHSSI